MSKLLNFMIERHTDVLWATGQHLLISLSAIVIAIAVAVPAGIWLTRRPNLAEPIMGVAGILQTIPSIALLAFMIPLLGVGRLPAVVALFLYALLPVMRNTFTGIRSVDQGALEAGRGMGMTSGQLLRMVELPMALPVIMGGVRVAMVLVIGWATLAAFIGGGGLGTLIVSGLTLSRTEMIMAGAIPATILALGADRILGWLERRFSARGTVVPVESTR